MPLSVVCDCGARITGLDRFAGKTIRCPKCKDTIAVPAPTEPSENRSDQFAFSASPSPPPRSRKRPDPSPIEKPPVHQRQPSGSADTTISSLGIGSLVLGLVAMPMSMFMCCGSVFSLPLSGLGIVLGAIGLIVSFCNSYRWIGLPIAGLAISMFSATIGLFWLGLISAATTGTSAAVSAATANVATRADATGEKPPPRPEIKTKPPAETPESVYTDASKHGSRIGDIEVHITSAKVDFAKFERLGTDHTSGEPVMILGVRITNHSETRKVEYRTWSASARRFRQPELGMLADNFKNRYKAIHFGLGSNIAGQVQQESIHPRKVLFDLLVFEKPIEKASNFYLYLPLSAFEHTEGSSEEFRFRIPVAAIAILAR